MPYMKYTKSEMNEMLESMQLEKEQKTKGKVSFLDMMVKVVFFSTFLFTVATMYVAYISSWEQAFVTLIERWFTIMVGEIVVTGIIQVVKEVMEYRGNRS